MWAPQQPFEQEMNPHHPPNYPIQNTYKPPSGNGPINGGFPPSNVVGAAPVSQSSGFMSTVNGTTTAYHGGMNTFYQLPNQPTTNPTMTQLLTTPNSYIQQQPPQQASYVGSGANFQVMNNYYPNNYQQSNYNQCTQPMPTQQHYWTNSPVIQPNISNNQMVNYANPQNSPSTSNKQHVFVNSSNMKQGTGSSSSGDMQSPSTSSPALATTSFIQQQQQPTQTFSEGNNKKGISKTQDNNSEDEEISDSIDSSEQAEDDSEYHPIACVQCRQ